MDAFVSTMADGEMKDMGMVIDRMSDIRNGGR